MAIKAKEDELLARLRAKYPVQVDDKVLGTVKVDVVPADGGAPDGARDAEKG
jgi:hypothetical protein